MRSTYGANVSYVRSPTCCWKPAYVMPGLLPCSRPNAVSAIGPSTARSDRSCSITAVPRRRRRCDMRSVSKLAARLRRLFGGAIIPGTHRGSAPAPDRASPFGVATWTYPVFSGPGKNVAELRATRRLCRVPLPPIIFEDESLLVFDKPSGLLVAPDRWDKARENLMTLVHRERGQHIANVHRLDADTSGVLLCAKTKPALDFLSGQFQSKTADKRYHALVVVLPEEEAMKVIPPIRDPQGWLPDEFDVDLALGQDEANPGRMRVFKRRGGKPSLTHFRTLERFGRFAWVECEPKTGRTHQLRVHLAAAGAPILNDRFYGVPE